MSISAPLHLRAARVNDAGQLCDPETGLLLRFAPQAHLHLLLHDAAHAGPAFPEEARRRLVVPADETLHFTLKQTEWGELRCTLRLLQDVWLTQEADDQLPALDPVQPCQLEAVEARYATVFQPQPPLPAPLFADTLNQAYFQASKLYEPRRASHATNVHSSLRTTRLDLTLREMWAVVGHQPDFWTAPG